MKRFFILLITSLMCLVSCEYDDSELRDAIKDHEDRIAGIEKLCSQLNSNIEALQTIVNVLKERDYITSISPLKEGDKEIGYTISFNKNHSVTLYHGKDGTDGMPGHSPCVVIKKDTDGVQYWMIDGEWMLDNEGCKIPAEGRRPIFKIEDSNWYVSNDEGKTWFDAGSAKGDSIFEDVQISKEDVQFTLSDGQSFNISRHELITISFDFDVNNVSVVPGKEILIKYTLQNADENTVVSVSSDGYYKVKLEDKSTTGGTIRIKCPDPYTDGYVNVHVSDGKGYTLLKVINFYQKKIDFEKGQKFNVSAKGDTISIPFSINFSYLVKQTEGSESWVKILPDTRVDMRQEKIIVEISANEGTTSRLAKLYICQDKGTEEPFSEITLMQSGQYCTISKNTIDVPVTGMHTSLEINSSYDLSCVVQENIDWLSASLSKVSYEKYSLNLEMKANTVSLPRSAEIHIMSLNENKKLGTVRVNQEGSIQFSPDEMVFIVQAMIKNEFEVVLPLSHLEGYVDWGDGTVESYEPSEDCVHHTYDLDATADFIVRVSGHVEYIRTNSKNSELETVTDVLQWGDTGLKQISFKNNKYLKSISNKGKNWTNQKIFSESFSGCTSLEAIPEKLFAQCPKTYKIFDGTFSNCTSLTELPEDLFDGCSSVTEFYKTFQGCSSLKSIPENLFSSCREATTFWQIFSGCSSLTAIPENLFANCSKATNFIGAFSDCKSLISVPEKLFVNCPKVTSFNETFSNCNSLKTIPGNLFANNKEVTDFNRTFLCCFDLDNIPENLFANTTNVCIFEGTFISCLSLKTLPENLFVNCAKVTTFDFVFGGCTSLVTLPDGLFINCPEVESFRMAFEDCISLIEIPENLFKNCRKVSNFEYAFSRCSSLITLPENLFSDCSKVKNFDSVFSDCTSMSKIPSGIFRNNRVVTNFDNCFSGCKSLTGESPYDVIEGTKIHLYEREKYLDYYFKPRGFFCFKECTDLTDYNLISSSWK